jgi:hypothetical protein
MMSSASTLAASGIPSLIGRWVLAIPIGLVARKVGQSSAIAAFIEYALSNATDGRTPMSVDGMVTHSAYY